MNGLAVARGVSVGTIVTVVESPSSLRDCNVLTTPVTSKL